MPQIHHCKDSGQRQKINSLSEPPAEKPDYDSLIENHKGDILHKWIQFHTTVANGMDCKEKVKKIQQIQCHAPPLCRILFPTCQHMSRAGGSRVGTGLTGMGSEAVIHSSPFGPGNA